MSNYGPVYHPNHVPGQFKITDVFVTPMHVKNSHLGPTANEVLLIHHFLQNNDPVKNLIAGHINLKWVTAKH